MGDDLVTIYGPSWGLVHCTPLMLPFPAENFIVQSHAREVWWWILWNANNGGLKGLRAKSAKICDAVSERKMEAFANTIEYIVDKQQEEQWAHNDALDYASGN